MNKHILTHSISMAMLTRKKGKDKMQKTLLGKKVKLKEFQGDLKAQNVDVPETVVGGAKSSGRNTLLESLSDITQQSGVNEKFCIGSNGIDCIEKQIQELITK